MSQQAQNDFYMTCHRRRHPRIVTLSWGSFLLSQFAHVQGDCGVGGAAPMECLRAVSPCFGFSRWADRERMK
jgi:hypothetical protein